MGKMVSSFPRYIMNCACILRTWRTFNKKGCLYYNIILLYYILSVTIRPDHRVGRVLSLFPVVGIGTPPTSHLRASVPPTPRSWGEGHTRWRERGWESPNSDEGTLWYSLYIRTLWARPSNKEDNRFMLSSSYSNPTSPTPILKSVWLTTFTALSYSFFPMCHGWLAFPSWR